jgi:parallel beta-helix repeat protein
MQQAKCGLTNTEWASCSQHVATSLAYYPVSGCSTLTRPGNYSMTANIINPAPMCITVDSDNVTFNCAGYSMTQTSGAQGPAIYVNGRKNVVIANCNIYGLTSAINVSNSSYIGVYGDWVHSSRYGISMRNVNMSTIEGIIATDASNASILLSRVSRSNIIDNNVSYGTGKNVGILVNNSQMNMIANNIGSTNYIGITFTGSSYNNTVMNNTMQLSGYMDYLCNGGNDGINAEFGGINYGTKKTGCLWLAALVKGGAQFSCQAVLTPGSYTFQNDETYDYGETCYNVYANGTDINCNGHTIIATNGGTFANFKDSNDSELQNCTLKGFTSPIIAYGSGVMILNNRITDNNRTNAAIAVTKAQGAYIQTNNITDLYQGISMESSKDSFLLNNMVALASTAYRISNSIGIAVSNNTAESGTGTGMALYNTTASTFKYNTWLSNEGIVCTGAAQSSLSNIDSGNNACSSNSGCAWIKSSNSTC